MERERPPFLAVTACLMIVLAKSACSLPSATKSLKTVFTRETNELLDQAATSVMLVHFIHMALAPPEKPRCCQKIEGGLPRTRVSAYSCSRDYPWGLQL